MLRWIKCKRYILLLSGLTLLALLCAACGGVNNRSVSDQAARGSYSTVNSVASHAAASAGSSQSTVALPPAVTAPQYLIKTLKVSMNVKNTMQVADDVQSWISRTDPLSSSQGTDYEQVGNNLYSISLTFSVEAKFYPQVYHYLRDYAGRHGGQLTAFTESVQDVSNDYIDTTSRLENLRAEQSRLIALMGKAQAMSDILSVEQQLTDVEGQIEDIEGHLNSLNAQVAFYTVEVSLQPLEVVPPPPPPPGWSIGQAFHSAIAASIGFGQGLITFVIWLLAFSIYLVPIALIALLVVRLRARARRAAPPTPSVK